MLMFCVVLDLGGIRLRGLLSLSAFQLPSGVANLNVVGLLVMLGWAASCCTGSSVLSKGVETGPTTTHFGSACAKTMLRLPRTSFTCP